MCDTLCAIGSTGTLFAKNSDRPRDEMQRIVRAPARPGGGQVRTQYLELHDPGAAAVMGGQPDWLWGYEFGVNEFGVAAGNEKIWTVDRPSAAAPALIGMDLVRLTLERATSAHGALDVLTELLEDHGQGGVAEGGHPNALDAKPKSYWSSFLLADARAAWMVETSGRTWVAQPVEGTAALSNRVSITTGWTRSSHDVAPGADFDRWRRPEAPTAHADVRLAASAQALAGGADQLTPERAARVMRDHGDGSGMSLCMHGEQATTASMLVWLPRDRGETPRAWVAVGSPCASIYVPVFPPAGVPPVLADPGMIAAFAAVRDLVEGDPERLATLTAVFSPIESELWAAAAACGDDPSARRELLHRLAPDRLQTALQAVRSALRVRG